MPEAGWLIFKLPPAEAAVHPDETPRAELYLMCDDLEADMQALADHGVTCAAVEEARWGSVTTFPSPRRSSGRPVPTAAPHGHRYEQLTKPVPTNARSRPPGPAGLRRDVSPTPEG